MAGADRQQPAGPGGQRPASRKDPAGQTVRRYTAVPRRATHGSKADPWPSRLRAIERKRRQYLRMQPPVRHPITRDLLERITLHSFRLEGITVDEPALRLAQTPGAGGRSFRSRAAQRLRNHLAILLTIENELRLASLLKVDDVVRWYTSISSGLSTTGLDANCLLRLDQFLRRINSPQMRLQQAVTEVAHLHWQLLSDPLVPSFNGILARLLLRYHLGRCGLPPVFLAELPPADAMTTESAWHATLVEMLEQSLDILSARAQ